MARFHKSLPCFVLLAVILTNFGLAQEILEEIKPEMTEPIFVRLTLYPTASLSRYDYNNDIDHFEVRAYAELHRNTQEGPLIPDARIFVLSELLEFTEGQYQKRIIVDKDHLPDEVNVQIVIGETVILKEKVPLATWIVLEEPRPAIIETAQDLTVRWRFQNVNAPVNMRAYNFRNGDLFYNAEDISETAILIPAQSLPPSTILRIYVIHSWLYKRFLSGDTLARGSEILVIPWSQVFLRTQ